MYTVRIHRADADQTGYWADVPALPGCVSEGESYQETLANIQEAMQLYIEGLIEEGLPVPIERPAKPAERVVMRVNVPATV